LFGGVNQRREGYYYMARFDNFSKVVTSQKLARCDNFSKVVTSQKLARFDNFSKVVNSQKSLPQ